MFWEQLSPPAFLQGERETWTKLSAIKANCGIELTIDACLVSLTAKPGNGKAPEAGQRSSFYRTSAGGTPSSRSLLRARSPSWINLTAYGGSPHPTKRLAKVVTSMGSGLRNVRAGDLEIFVGVVLAARWKACCCHRLPPPGGAPRTATPGGPRTRLGAFEAMRDLSLRWHDAGMPNVSSDDQLEKQDSGSLDSPRASSASSRPVLADLKGESSRPAASKDPNDTHLGRIKLLILLHPRGPGLASWWESGLLPVFRKPEAVLSCRQQITRGTEAH